MTVQETLEAYMIREMAAALEIRGGKPDADFHQALENDRYRLGHGPWTPYEQQIKQKWEQGRSYSADLVETLRQHDEQWKEREQWRAERNRKRKADDTQQAAQKREALTAESLMKRISKIGAIVFFVIWVLAGLVEFFYYWQVMTSWLGTILGSLVAFLASPGVFVFPLIYWFVQGVFPTFYFEVLGVCLGSGVIGAFLWSVGSD